jgi:hypothetical protein
LPSPKRSCDLALSLVQACLSLQEYVRVLRSLQLGLIKALSIVGPAVARENTLPFLNSEVLRQTSDNIEQSGSAQL